MVPVAAFWLALSPGGADPDYGEPPCPNGLGCHPSPSPPEPSPTPAVPGRPEPLAPYDTVTDARPAFLWREVPQAAEYLVTVVAGGVEVHRASYPAATVCQAGHCLAPAPATPLAPGLHHWEVSALGVADGGSAGQDFTVSTARLARIVHHNVASGHLRAWYLAGGSVVGAAALPASRKDAFVAGTGDFNGDGRADLLWREPRATRALSSWEMSGLQAVAGPWFPRPGPEVTIRAVADFNRDGSPDLLLSDGSVQYRKGPLVIGTAALTARDNDPDEYWAVAYWHAMGAGDFNRDGWPDVLWRNALTLDIEVWYMQGAQRIGHAHLGTAALTDLHLRGVADVDGDGDADVLLWRLSDGATLAWLTDAQADGTLRVVERMLGTDADRRWRVAGFLPPEQPVPAMVRVNGSASSITVDLGAPVTVQIHGGPAQPWDWVAKHGTLKANNDHPNDWQYLDGSQAQPQAGQSDATLHFRMPSIPGDYHFRFFRNDTYEVLGVSPTVTVRSFATLTVNGSSSAIAAAPGGKVTVHVVGAPGTGAEWVAKHVASAGDRAHANDWAYLDGSQTLPETGRTEATLTVTMPSQVGDYNFRLFQNETYTLLATSPIVTVLPPTVTVNGSASTVAVAPGAVVRVDVAGGPAHPWDWMSLHAFEAENHVHSNDWQYLDGTQTRPSVGLAAASLTFTIPSTPGAYHFRFFHKDTYERLATSPLVIVAVPPAP